MNKTLRGFLASHRLKDAMIKKMNTPRNLAKGDWKDVSTKYLVMRLKEEVVELEHAILYESQNNIELECADVGNFLMMIYDNEVLRNWRDK
jgi:hypothetical protein